MPPKPTYNRNDVIVAALQLAEDKGVSALTARGVAQVLGSSTAPVYRYFANMRELEGVVVRRTLDRVVDYCTRPLTDSCFLDIGVGYVIFAREHRQLFRSVFLVGDEYRDAMYDLEGVLLPLLDGDAHLHCLDAGRKLGLLRKMSIVTHGLAAMINVGMLESDSDEFIIETLRMLGRPVIGEALAAAEGIPPVDLARFLPEEKRGK